MLHDSEIGLGRALIPFTSACLPPGRSGLTLGPIVPPIRLALWGIVAEFLIISVWPSRMASTGGSNRQHGWSTSTLSLAGLARLGWIGRGVSFLSAEISQTTAWGIPPFFGFT